MSIATDREPLRPTLALNLELCHGQPGASARVEIYERPQAAVRRVAIVALRGWIDRAAERRLERALADLEARGVEQVLLDCSQLRHIDFRMVPALVDTLARFDRDASGFVVCGLSRHLRDLFRFAGCEARLRCWPSASDLLASPSLSSGAGGECAS